MKKISKSNIAYIAGFFDGEGCIHFAQPEQTSSYRLVIANTDYDILVWIQKILGLGKITIQPLNSKYPRSKRVFFWRLYKRQDILELLKALLLHLKIKKEQARIAIKILQLSLKRQPRYRGNTCLGEKEIELRRLLKTKVKRGVKKEEVA